MTSPYHSSTVNKQRSSKLAAERKVYCLSFGQDCQNPSGYFCITETRLASGQRKVFPTKWQLLQNTRSVVHRHHQPAKSILRRFKSDKPNNKVRFSSRCDQRFYQKGSISHEQLVKISYGTQKEQELADLIEIATSTASEEPYCAIQDVVGAVKNGWSVEDVILLLQNDMDRTFQDPSVDEKWLQNLYQCVKKRKSELSSATRGDNSDIETASQMQKLFNIYVHAETVVASARSLKQWGRYEIIIESISELSPTTTEYEGGKLSGVVYFSAKGGPPERLGILPQATMSTSVNYSLEQPRSGDSSIRYLVHHNPGIPDEKRELSVMLYWDDEQVLGSVKLPCTEVSSLCTQFKKPYTLEKDIISDNDLSSKEGKIQFSIRKIDLKRGYLAGKRQVAANKLRDVIGWISRFNIDTSNILSGHICAKGNISLLHAAILFHEPKLVERLMKLNANPYSHSNMGSAMALALNMSDGSYKDPEERKALENIIKILQGHFVYDDSSRDSENRSPVSGSKQSWSTAKTMAKTKKTPLAQTNSRRNQKTYPPLTKTAPQTSTADLSRAMYRLDIN